MCKGLKVRMVGFNLKLTVICGSSSFPLLLASTVPYHVKRKPAQNSTKLDENGSLGIIMYRVETYGSQ